MEIILRIMEYVLTVIVIWSVIKLVTDAVTDIVNSRKCARWVKLAPYTRIVSEAILYTNDILAEKKIKRFPGYKIRYYRHKKYSGVFDGTVTVYLGSNNSIPELVDTVLHEVQHYVQSQTDRHYKYYDQYTAEKGYWNNPFEVECREFAARHRDICLRHLESKKLIARA